MNSLSRFLTFFVLSHVVFASTTHAQDLIFTDSIEGCLSGDQVDWDGGGDGTSWSDELNWEGDTLPADGDEVSIRSGEAVTVVYNTSAGSLRVTCLDSSKPLNITGGILEIDGGGWIGSNLTVTGGTLTTTGILFVVGTLEQSSGTMNGLGTVTAGGVFTWSGGSQSEAGETVANGGVVLTGASGRDLKNGRILTINGASTWNQGRMRLWSAVTINNNDAFDIQTDEDMLLWSGAVSTFNNNGGGTITKSANAAVTQLDMIFNNSGAVAVTSGELWLGRSNVAGTSTGSFDIAAGSVLGITGSHTMSGSFSGAGTLVNIAGGTSVISGSYTVSGPLQVKGGTLSFDIPVTIDDDVAVTGGALAYNQATSVNGNVALSTGTLTAAGSLAISGTLEQSSGTMNGLGTVTSGGVFTWSGGSQSEAGETVANGGVVLTGASGRDLKNGRILTINGASTWNQGRMRLWSAVMINNNDAFDIQTDEDMLLWSGAVSTFNNNGGGTITKSANAAVTQLDMIFNNSGAVAVTSGELWLGRSNVAGTSTGSFDIAAGSVLGITGSHTMSGSFSGAGTLVNIAGGTSVISGSYTVSGPLQVKGGTLSFDIPVTIDDDVAVTGGALAYNQATSVNGNVALSTGTLTAAGSLAISGTLEQSSGTMNGLGTVTAGGVFTWSGGSQSEAGETVANGGVVLTGASGRDLKNGRILTINGASTWNQGRMRLWSAVMINNNDAFDIQTDEDMLLWSGAVSTFNNNGGGTITKSANAAVTQLDMIFNNSGAVAVTSGELWLGRSNVAGTSTGSFDIAAGSVLGITGSHTMSGSFSGAGTLVNIAGGTSVISGSYTVSGPLQVKGGTLSFDIPVTIDDDVAVTGGALAYNQATSVNGNVALSTGTLTAAGSLAISGTLEQSSGTMNGLGTVTAGGVFTWSGGSQSEAGETVANGGVVLTGASGRDLKNGRILTINGASTWNQGRMRLWSAVTINNNDAFDIQTDEDMLLWSGAVSTFNNNGGGTITKSANAAVTQLDMIFNNSGAVAVTSGELWLGRSNVAGTSTGSFDIAAGSVLGITGSHTMSGSFSGAGTLVNIAGGTSVISGSYTVSGPLQVKGGTLSFDIPVTIDDDVAVTGGALAYNQATSVNGNVALSTGTLTAAGSLAISGTLEQSSGTMNGLGTVTSGGVFTWSGGSQSEAGETVANGGVVLTGASGRDLKNGRILTINGASTWNQGRMRLWSAVTINNNDAFDIQTDEDMLLWSGAVSTFNNNGGGTITKSANAAVTQLDMIFNNSGRVTVDAGALTFSRPFTQLSTGTLDVHILGVSNFDVFTMTQSAALDGTVNIIRNGYSPAGGTAFDILTCNTCSGSFATVNGNGVTFTQNVTANKVTLTAN